MYMWNVKKNSKKSQISQEKLTVLIDSDSSYITIVLWHITMLQYKTYLWTDY